MTLRHRTWKCAFAAAVLIVVAGLVATASQVRVSPQAAKTKQAPPANLQTNCNVPAVSDIVLVKIAITSGSDSKFAPGKTYGITAVLENRGQCETGPFRVRISVYAQDTVVGSAEERVILDRLVQSIQPTRDKTPAYTYVTVNYTLGPNYSSTYDFMAVADPQDRVKEFIENNNAIDRGWGITIDVGPPIR